jgi:hypothetical protein
VPEATPNPNVSSVAEQEKKTKREIRETAVETARAMAEETARAQSLYRMSSTEPNYDYPYNPENYDVCAEADKAAKKNGHGNLSKWVPLRGEKAFWNMQCLTCGGFAYARWLGQFKNDIREGVTAQSPAFGGDIIQSTCAQVSGTREQRSEFVGRTSQDDFKPGR